MLFYILTIIYHINKIKSIIIYFTNSNNEYDIFNLCNKILNLLEKQKGKKLIRTFNIFFLVKLR